MMVELDTGCYHMTCRCRAQFCYLCAERWKSCVCPQWEEARLLQRAEQQVENQFGAPAVRAGDRARHAARVEAAAERLRVNHHCAHTDWTVRGGGGRCESCNYTLDRYLLRCRGCQMLACVRCQRNRL